MRVQGQTTSELPLAEVEEKLRKVLFLAASPELERLGKFVLVSHESNNTSSSDKMRIEAGEATVAQASVLDLVPLMRACVELPDIAEISIGEAASHDKSVVINGAKKWIRPRLEAPLRLKQLPRLVCLLRTAIPQLQYFHCVNLIAPVMPRHDEHVHAEQA